MGFWDLIEPIWFKNLIHEEPETFLAKYAEVPKASRILYAAHWCQAEVSNGGFWQFFANATGVLAPEAVEAFRTIGMPETAAIVEKAMLIFGPEYPRDRSEREDATFEILEKATPDSPPPFQPLDKDFYSLIKSENGGYRAAADKYAASNT